MDEPRRPSHAPWALALAAVAMVAIVVAGALYVFHSVRRLPVDVLEGGRQALRDLREVAAAFRTGTVTTTFRGYATEVSGTTRRSSPSCGRRNRSSGATARLSCGGRSPCPTWW